MDEMKLGNNREMLRSVIKALRDADFSVLCYDTWFTDDDLEDYDLDYTTFDVGSNSAKDAYTVSLKIDIEKRAWCLTADSGYYDVTKPRPFDLSKGNWQFPLVTLLNLSLVVDQP